MDENRIEVKSSLGTMVAESTGNPEYPGIYLSFVEGENSSMERICALYEVAKDTPRTGETELRLLVYTDNDSDEYTNKHVLLRQGQPQYEIWIEPENYATYAVRVRDILADTPVPEMEDAELHDLPRAISAMGRIARNNPDIVWSFRNFSLEVPQK